MRTRGKVEPALHPSGVRLRRPVRGLRDSEALEQRSGSVPDRVSLHVIEATHDLEVLAPGQLELDRGRLAGKPDAPPDCRSVAHHVVSLDDHAPGVRAEQRCQHAHRGGLAGTVGAEHAEHAASRNVEVDPAQGVHLAKGLVEA